MPKFFADADDFFSSDEDDSEVDFSSAEDEEEQDLSDDEPSTTVSAPTGAGRQWLRAGFSSDDEEDSKRVVRSQKDKRFDELQKMIKDSRNSMKINDWVAIQAGFQKLTQCMDKAKNVIKKEGVPRFFIRFLVELEDFGTKSAANKDLKKSMSTKNFKSMNTMRQKLKKYCKNYTQDIEAFKQAPEEEQEVEEVEVQSESDDDSDQDDAPKRAPRGRSFWLKKDGASDSESDSDDDFDDFDDDDFTKKKKRGKKKKGRGVKKVKSTPKAAPATAKKVEWTEELVDKKLKALINKRGRRGYDKQDQVKRFQELKEKSKSIRQTAEILLALISAQYDLSPSMNAYMPLDIWRSAYRNILELVLVLEMNTNLHVRTIEQRGKGDNLPEGHVAITGDLYTMFVRLSNEFTKSLQELDPHTNDYVNRLFDEASIIYLAARIQRYFSRVNEYTNMARIVITRMEHAYYKKDSFIENAEVVARKRHDALESELQANIEKLEETIKAEQAKSTKPESDDSDQKSTPNSSFRVPLKKSPEPMKKEEVTSFLGKLASQIYTYGDERLKARAVLFMIYHHALHNRFYQARDLMLMSHLQDTAANMDPSTQILFNRAMVQTGLCAFRQGMIYECHSCLSEFYTSGRVKELLAQGLMNNRYGDQRNSEQESIEKRRQMPYHMHINLEMLECSYLTCALLLEVPNMAANKLEPKKKIVSRHFRRLLDYHERQDFAGPPENNREHMIAGSKALGKGDWKTCADLIFGLPFWKLVDDSETVRELIKTKMQEEGLRAFLFNFSSHYDSISLTNLSNMFSLNENQVHSIVSKMMINEELQASWDQPTNSILIHRPEPSPLQKLALQYSDKISGFVESNERLESSRGYVFGDNQHRQWQDRRGGDRRDRRGGDRRGDRRDNRRRNYDRKDNRRNNHDNGGYRQRNKGRNRQ